MNTPRVRPRQAPMSSRSQRGSTLVVALLMLIIILLLGVSAMVSSDTQSKLTGNLQFENVAFNMAEQALLDAEAILRGYDQGAADAGFTTYNATATACYYPIGYLEGQAAPNNDPLTMTWGSTNSCADSYNSGNARYIIQKISSNVLLTSSSHTTGGHATTPPVLVDTYLITAFATAPRGTTKYLQSYFSVRLPS